MKVWISKVLIENGVAKAEFGQNVRNETVVTLGYVDEVWLKVRGVLLFLKSGELLLFEFGHICYEVWQGRVRPVVVIE